MKKRILFLMTDIRFLNFFDKLGERLLKEGHSVLVLPTTPAPGGDPRFDVRQERWDNFDFTSIEAFDPTCIIVFNGYHPSIIPAIGYLKKKYNLFHCECGWLPQKARAYLDTDMGYGGEISKGFKKTAGYIMSTNQLKLLEELRKYYEPKKPSVQIPKNFILVPLQVEHDVSIWKDSPHFRLMRSLIGFIRKQAPGIPIIAKQHPLGLAKERYNDWNKLPEGPGIQTIFDRSISTNDLVPLCTIMVGINSTTFLEAMVHHKPQITFGGSVGFQADDLHFHDPSRLSRTIRDIFAGTHIVDTEMMDQKLLYLSANQYRITDPAPDWLMEKVLEYKTEPRSYQDLA